MTDTLRDFTPVWETAPTPINDLLRYSTEGAWATPDAIMWRRIHWAYTCAVAVPVTAFAYPTAAAVQHVAGLKPTVDTTPSEPLTANTKAGQRVLDAVARTPQPPPLVDLWHEVVDDAATRTSAAGQVAAWGIGGAALALSALLYGMAWLLQRPGRLAYAATLCLAIRLI